jgi:hypothetical protein
MRTIPLGLLSLLISIPIYAQKDKDFRTGHLVKIEVVFIPMEAGRTTYKANYLIKLRDGSAETVALYHVTIFGHDYVKPLKEDTDIPYRISGKHLFLKSPEGHEIKALLCEVKSDCALCGSDSFCNLK